MGSLLMLIEVYTEKVQFSKSFGDIVALCWLSDYLINIHLLDSMYNPGLPLCQFQVRLVFEAKESLATIWVGFFFIRGEYFVVRRKLKNFYYHGNYLSYRGEKKWGWTQHGNWFLSPLWYFFLFFFCPPIYTITSVFLVLSK